MHVQYNKHNCICRIISNLYASGWGSYYRYPHQRADQVEELQVSEDYMLVAEFKEGGGGDYIQVLNRIR